LAESLPQEPFQAVSDDRIAGGLADRDAEPWIAATIRGHIQKEQTVTGPPAVVQHGLELAVARQPFSLWKGQCHLRFTIDYLRFAVYCLPNSK
jgi:hypothetical protein